MNAVWLLFLLGSELPAVFLLAFAAACRAGMGGSRRGAALLTAVMTPLAAEVLRHLLLRSGQYLFLVHPREVLACMLAGGLLGYAASRGRRAAPLLMLTDSLGVFLFSALMVHAGLASGLYAPQDVGLALLAWLAAGLTVLLLWGCYLVSPWLALAVESLLSYQLLATKSLAAESRKVYDALKTGDLDKALKEIKRALKSGGIFYCSAYGADHMAEISRLVQDFDSRIILSADKLYEKFGRENGPAFLNPCFSSVEWHQYEDSLLVTQAEPLIAYILSCHGNQNQYILDRYKEFRSFVSKKTADGFYITKDAGFFACQK